ncbi:MAG: hypothetical protein NTV34_13150 [Proteobacteria bacterium]|nr:hypothetical protein [Pseudomonadota bacterium]
MMSKNGFQNIFFGAALIQSELPHLERIKILEKHFFPKPGEEVKLDEYVANTFAKTDRDRGLLYGSIEVTPPKGQCFTITTDPERPDIEVCNNKTPARKTPVRWYLETIDRHSGKFTWTIKTGKNDFGTKITWKTPYVIGKIIPDGFAFNEANSTALFIKSCDAIAADPINFAGRRINLKFFNGQAWTIRFPDKDQELPAYIPPPPPLTLAELAEIDKQKKKKKAEGHSAESDEPSVDEKPAPPKPIPEEWTLSTRRGFEMDVSNVIADGTVAAPKTKGKCRYQYDAVIGDLDTGRIECHYGDVFLYFYAPLPCLKFIKPK